MPLKQSLNYLIGQTQKDSAVPLHIGVIVQSLKTGKILYQRHAREMYTPASIQKLFVAVSALDYLKPNYRFQTRLLLSNRNLYIQFTGDPTLTTDDLNTLFKKLNEKGARFIKHVYIDNTDYNQIPYPPGWIWDDLSYSFAAPMNAAIIDKNKFLVHFFPKKLGAHPSVTFDLPKGIAHFSNQIITVKDYKKSCPITVYSNTSNYYQLGGCLVKSWGEQRRSLAVRDIDRYTKNIVQMLLAKNKIQYQGAIEFKQKPASFRVIATHYSDSLSNILIEMLKDSDNLVADAIFKKIGELYSGTQGNWQNSRKAIHHILNQDADINFKHAMYIDGAGLSRYNLMSPHEMLKLLDFAYRNKTIYSILINALPIAGVDGTLQDRMKRFAKNQRIHAKTGSMTGVNSLAGYIQTKHHGDVAFVIMVNGIIGSSKPVHLLQAAICKGIINNG